MMDSDKEYTIAEVSEHRSFDDCWMILGSEGKRMVYDITGFLDDHPGGPEILMDLAGQIAHDEFEDIGHSENAIKMLPSLCIGKLKETAESMEKGKKTLSSVTDTSNRSIPTALLFGGLVMIIFAWLFYPVE